MSMMMGFFYVVVDAEVEAKIRLIFDFSLVYPSREPSLSTIGGKSLACLFSR